jgi:hypothetical protein
MAALGKVEGRFSVTISVIAPLHSPLAAVQRLLERFGNQGVIIDGVAASMLGTPLDRTRIERWVREFAEALEMPELWEDIAPLLKL